MSNIEPPLSQRLYRFDCIELDVLQAYLWNELTLGQRLNAELHVRRCPLCRNELAQLEIALHDGETQVASVLDRVKQVVRRVVAEVVSVSAESNRTLRHARGPEQGKLLMYQADHGVMFSLRWDEDETGHLILSGQIMSDTIGTDTAHLVQVGQATPYAVVPLAQEDGSYQFNNVDAGDYQLIFTLNDTQVELSIDLSP